jgi:hypothetical protein
MVDSWNQNAVAGLKVMRPVIEKDVDVAKDDRVEVDGVGVVYLRALPGTELDHHPSCDPWRDP